MAETQNGRAVLWGVGTGIGITGYASFTVESGKLDHKFKLTEIDDESGDDISLVSTNEHFEASITFIPERGGVALPVALAKITTSGFNADDLNGDWVYVGDASVDLSHAAGKVSLKVRKYVNNNASLTSAAT